MAPVDNCFMTFSRMGLFTGDLTSILFKVSKSTCTISLRAGIVSLTNHPDFSFFKTSIFPCLSVITTREIADVSAMEKSFNCEAILERSPLNLNK